MLINSNGGIIPTVMSCDQSFLNFAVVVFDNTSGRYKATDRAVFHTGENVPSNSKKEYGEYFPTIQEQLQYIYKGFKEFYLKHKPDYLVFEGLAFGAKGDRVFSLGGLYYYITTSLINDGLLSPEQLGKVTPTAVKKIARSHLPSEDQYERGKDGEILFNKSKKPKLNSMPKKFVLKALQNGFDSWILDGYSVSSNKIETGVHDLPDAFFIGKAFIETLK